MQKALIVATVYGFIASFEQNDIQILQSLGYEVWCACNTEEANGQLEKLNVRMISIPFARNPFSKVNVIAYKKLKSLIQKEKFNLVHCHTPVGGVLGRLAAVSGKADRIIYTAHGFHFYTGAPKLNWLLYYPIEKWLATKTDVLITINQEDYQRAKKHFHAKSVQYVPGVGVDIERIQNIIYNTSREQKRKELGIPMEAFLMMSVGELNTNKNHQMVIKALAEVKDNSNIHYIICGKGILEQELKELAETLGLKNQVHLLGYRNDVFELMACADLYIHPSLREGLPVALMEAMASGLPVIGSRIRGIMDLLPEKSLCDVKSNDEYIDKINIVIDNEEERNRLKKGSIYQIIKNDIHIVEQQMKDVYIQ